MRIVLRLTSIFCVFLMLALAVGPAQTNLVEEIESQPIHLVYQECAPRRFQLSTLPEACLRWPAPERMTPQYDPKKELRPPRFS